MPARNWLTVAFTFKQFFTAFLLRIFPIPNLVPRTLLSPRDVRTGFVFRYHALQIQFANTLKQRSPRALYVLHISQRRCGRGLCQQATKFLLAVYQSLSSPILSVTGQ